MSQSSTTSHYTIPCDSATTKSNLSNAVVSGLSLSWTGPRQSSTTSHYTILSRLISRRLKNRIVWGRLKTPSLRACWRICWDRWSVLVCCAKLTAGFAISASPSHLAHLFQDKGDVSPKHSGAESAPKDDDQSTATRQSADDDDNRHPCKCGICVDGWKPARRIGHHLPHVRVVSLTLWRTACILAMHVLTLNASF